MLYAELFRALEEVRWNLEDDVPWSTFDGALLSDEQARAVGFDEVGRASNITGCTVDRDLHVGKVKGRCEDSVEVLHSCQATSFSLRRGGCN